MQAVVFSGFIGAVALSSAQLATSAKNAQRAAQLSLDLNSVTTAAEAILRDVNDRAENVSILSTRNITMPINPKKPQIITLRELRLPVPTGQLPRAFLTVNREASAGLVIRNMYFRNFRQLDNRYFSAEFVIEASPGTVSPNGTILNSGGNSNIIRSIPFDVGLLTTNIGGGRFRIDDIGEIPQPPEKVSLMGCYARPKPLLPLPGFKFPNDIDPCPDLNIMGFRYQQESGKDLLTPEALLLSGALGANTCSSTFEVVLKDPIFNKTIDKKDLPTFPKSVVCKLTNQRW